MARAAAAGPDKLGEPRNHSPRGRFPQVRVTDESLMRAVRDGDLAKLGPLFERHHVRLFDFLTRVTGDRNVAEDLVQEVFVRILKYRSTFRDTGSFEPWLSVMDADGAFRYRRKA